MTEHSFAPNISKLLPIGKAKDFIMALVRFRLGVTVIISGKDGNQTFAGVAPKEVFWEYESRREDLKKPWSERRFGKFLEKKIVTSS